MGGIAGNEFEGAFEEGDLHQASALDTARLVAGHGGLRQTLMEALAKAYLGKSEPGRPAGQSAVGG